MASGFILTKKIKVIIAIFLFILFYSGIEAKAQIKRDGGYDEIIQTIADKHGVEAPLIHSIIKAESNYNTNALSTKGAIGLMQLMPETSRKYGVTNPYNPEDNIEGGVKYLKDLIKVYSGRTELVLAAYNAGQEAIKKYGGIPPYPETRNYIEKVKNYGYRKSFIRHRTKIYTYYDKSGRVVFTNNRDLYLMNKKDN